MMVLPGVPLFSSSLLILYTRLLGGLFEVEYRLGNAKNIHFVSCIVTTCFHYQSNIRVSGQDRIRNLSRSLFVSWIAMVIGGR